MSETKPVEAGIDADLELVIRLGRAWRAVRRGASVGKVRDRIYGTGADAIEPGQMDAMDLLVQVDSYRMGDLATALVIDPSTATRAVQRLIKDGLVEHVSRGGDARVVHVAATEKGRRIHDEVAERRRAVLREVLAKFPDDEASLITEYLEKFASGIEAVAREKPHRRK